jgi:hypothetical protein
MPDVFGFLRYGEGPGLRKSYAPGESGLSATLEGSSSAHRAACLLLLGPWESILFCYFLMTLYAEFDFHETARHRDCGRQQ